MAYMLDKHACVYIQHAHIQYTFSKLRIPQRSEAHQRRLLIRPRLVHHSFHLSLEDHRNS